MFRLLDPAQFQTCFLRFMQDFVAAASGVVAIDGKRLRRSFERASQISPLHLVSAWAADTCSEPQTSAARIAIIGQS